MDVIARLTQVQAGHPQVQIRRGKKDSWEIWSPAASETAATAGPGPHRYRTVPGRTRRSST